MKKLLFFVCLLFFIVFFNSCSEDPVNTNDGKKTPVVGEIYVSDEAFKYIGYGYDMTENYADPSHVKGIIFMGYKLPDEYTKKTKIENSLFVSYSGESVEEYQTALSNKFSAEGKYKFFSGSLKVNFKSEFYSSDKTSFATIQCMINKYQYTVVNNYSQASILKPYMTEQAVKDLNNSILTPFQIYEMYGTHVITGVMMGARLDYNTSIVSSFNKTGKSLEVLAKADYKTKFASASVSNGFSSETERKEFQEYRSLTINLKGGDSQYITDIAVKNDSTKYDAWIRSINKDNVVFCDYTDGGLIPIWEFVNDSLPDRKKALIDSLSRYIEYRKIKVSDKTYPPRNCIVDVIAYGSNMGDYIDQNGMRYYRIDSDLNSGCGSKTNYIYLYYAIELDNTTGSYQPITDLYLQYSSHSGVARAAKSGYEIIDCDLNKGAGGDFIFLFKSRDKKYGSPIRGLEVYNKTRLTYKFSDDLLITGYYDVRSNGVVPLDLNRGAGGDFIYLKYSRD